MVSFCVIRVELEDRGNIIDLDFNSYKSVEDLLEDLSLCEAARPFRPLLDEKERLRFRGNRRMTQLKVETFVDFSSNMDGRESKESSPGDSLSSTNSSRESSKRSTKDSTPASGIQPLESEVDQINFVSGNPAAEVTNGILHLYKENHTTSLDEGIIRSPMICMLGVPTKLKTPDLLSFTAAVHSQLEMMRIIHDGNPHQFMVLLRFRCQEAADEFYQAFNGLPYNSFEPEDLCHLVYISKVETCKESEFYPLSNHTELPVCSICLERMDESISTVLTILCNHTFHSSCLGQWEDATCPVCRYIQTPELVAEQRCSECNSPDDLWICLICGYVGCGRYIGGHSHAHFLDTGHSYTMELGQTSRVWDYVGDNFVHRLLQTDSANGKLVATDSGTCPVGKTCDGTCPCGEEKLKSFQLELYYTLTTQLEKQRQHYEAKLAKVEANSQKELSDLMNEARASSEEVKKLEAKIVSLNKEKVKYETKMNQLSQRLAKALSELVDEKHLNESLRKNQTSLIEKMNSYDQRLTSRDSEIQELKDQLRDLMVHFTASEKITGDGDLQEINGGDLIVHTPLPSADSKSKGAIRKKKGGK